ncbi:MAG: response regulator [Clostridiaceae bacterium]|jgi:response regulator NasT|nr:response regulator [Clostridiaceae bacterium]
MKTLIIADDEPITRMDIRQMVEENGFSVLGEASDGFDAIELCRLHHPDIVLMDIKMPLFDGLEAARNILEQDLSGCVVMLTAYSDQELIERAGRAGVTGYLVKPIDQKRLLPAIEIAIAQGKRIKQAKTEAEKAKKRLNDSRIIDHAKAIIASEMEISEAQAYRELQSMSMSKHCAMASLAAKIVEGKSQLTEVRRAKMLLMEHYGLSEAAAYRRLSTRARQENRSVQEMASLILEKSKELNGGKD